jgi:hypothetical protein
MLFERKIGDIPQWVTSQAADEISPILHFHLIVVYDDGIKGVHEALFDAHHVICMRDIR